MHSALTSKGNPALSGRLHLYGDVYSSPGLLLRQKQLLMVAFLAEADMHEQLFGHLIAVQPRSHTLVACNIFKP